MGSHRGRIALRGGPVFVWLKVKGELGKPTPAPPRPMAEQIERLRVGLGDRPA